MIRIRTAPADLIACGESEGVEEETGGSAITVHERMKRLHLSHVVCKLVHEIIDIINGTEISVITEL